MRARYPDRSGVVSRGEVDIHYEEYGEGEPSLVLIPPSPITHSRIYKGLVPHLSRSHRIVAIDGRGNGHSGRPPGVEAYHRSENVADIVAVMEETDVREAVLVAHCHANWWAVEVATRCRDRVRGLVSISPGVPYMGESHPHWRGVSERWNEIIDDPRGWELCNRHALEADLRPWVEFFFGAQLVEPHSTKQHEDAVDWAMESSGRVLADGEEAEDLDPPGREQFEAQCRRLGLPVLVIHGDRDVCQHISRGRAFAEVTGGESMIMEGSGHLPLARDPVAVNRSITDFVGRTTAKPARSKTWTRGLDRRKRLLYLSSPIGLGHIKRDLAIVDEIRARDPDLLVEWLAQDPVTRVLADRGESIHPASEWLASESAHIASESEGHDLHCFQALRRMDEILVANFMIFQEVVEEGLYDLVVGDEAWDVDHFWHENPELKRGSHVWMTDFVGFLPMPDGGDREAFLTADYNAEMIEHIARFPRIRDRALFVGNPDDVIADVFGPDLPKIRDWTEEHFAFSGYITGFQPPSPDEAAEWRNDAGWSADEKVCVVTVGGSGVGRDLLERAVAAFPYAKEECPELRMVAVAGPRIDPASFGQRPGLEIHGYVPDLYRYLAACDLAVVQGGLTTTMELTAAKRPFIYFPLRHHFEQNFHVRHRLDQYGAGQHMDYATTGTEDLAEAIVGTIGAEVDYRDVETDGAARAAALISELI
ncbi:MAG TPA: alpha/beta fold hydrolase [Acidimicrobiia bacterium]|nr:alpha/beta fold hydrolase [Acidimicrobiia bacterium]